MRLASVQEMFCDIAGRYPRSVALEHKNHSWTYAQLEEKSLAIARRLRYCGSQRGDVVLVFVEDRCQIIAAVLGILRAGCAFCPIVQELPDQYIKRLLEQCSPHRAIVDSSCTIRLGAICRELDQPVELLVREELESASVVTEDSSIITEPDDLSYIVFTSGSTGQPKAIAGRSKSIDHFIRWEIQTLNIGHGTRISQFMSPMFDAFLRDVFTPLCAGGTVCIPPDRDVYLDGSRNSDWLRSQKINLVHMVPSAFRLLLDCSDSRRVFEDLRYVILAGEPLQPIDVEKWYHQCAQRASLINLYGPSETTMTKFMYCLSSQDHLRRSIPIGKPMEGAEAIVVDSNGRICPQGTVGEILIKTRFSSLGYYRRPDLTDAVFLEQPSTDGMPSIVYKTGDLGRVMEDGNFEFIGRRDHQVKIRGIRVELQELESVLRKCEGVDQAAVLDLEDAFGNKYLCAYIVTHGAISVEALRQHMAQSLPAQMTPSIYVQLPKLPLLPNGKLDRKALPEPEKGGGTRVYFAPRTADEELLSAIFGKVLKLDRVSIRESFFELSGHSLLATQVMSRIKSILGVNLPLRALFESPTVEGLAVQIREARKKQSRATLPLTHLVHGDTCPLSYAQQRLWFLNQLHPMETAYNMCFGLHLSGKLDTLAMERSLQEIVRRHEILRTIFFEENGVPWQRVTAPSVLNIDELDMTSLDADDKETNIRKWMQAEAEEPFNLARGPLLRVRRLRFQDEECVVLVTMHHIVSDAWSVGIMIREFKELYRAFCEGGQSPLKGLEIQYADYVAWQRECLSDQALEQQLKYWRAQLDGMVPLDLSLGKPLRETGGNNCGSLDFYLSQELTVKLKNLCHAHAVTLFMGLLAGVQVALSVYVDKKDIALGTVVANRNPLETESLIGFFANTLILRIKLDEKASIRQWLENIRTITLGAYDHQDVPFEKLAEQLQPERYLSRSPLVEAMLVLQNNEEETLELPGLKVTSLKSSRRQPTFDLLLSLQEGSGKLYGTFEYSTAIVEKPSIGLLKDMLEKALAFIVDRPDCKIFEIVEELTLLMTQHRKERQLKLEDAWARRLIAATRKPGATSLG